MKKNTFFKVIIFSVLLVSVLFASLISAGARGLVDTNKECSLTIGYNYDGKFFEGLEIKIYRVADFTEGGVFELTGEFAKLPIDVSAVTSQAEWDVIASTLDTVISTSDIAPTAKKLTDISGQVRFNGLVPGLYLVMEAVAEYEGGRCVFETFLIAVPGIDGDDNWVYDIMSVPKSIRDEITETEIEYTVVKLWNDMGYESLRPESVSVDIYKDGVLVDTVVLSKDNNWSYLWKAKDDGAKWTAVENPVPEGYYVTYDGNDTKFIITNRYHGDDPLPPQTGDISVQHLVLLLAGAVVVTVFAVKFTARRKGRV